MSGQSDLYGVLGVDKRAPVDEINRAFRKKALVNHPDRGGDKEAFQKLQAAHDVLSDSDKRAHYDATGQIPGEGGQPAPPDLSAMFGSMFGGGGGMPFFGMGMRNPGAQVAKGPNKLHEIGVSLADLYKGIKFTLSIKRDVICGGCKGKGGTRVESCGACGGKGMRMRHIQMGPITTIAQEPCVTCQQTGQKVLDECVRCRGRRLIETETSLEVTIEPGMISGDRIVFEGKCSESPMFEQPGDVILLLQAANTDSEGWVRAGSMLTHTVEVSLAESLLGWERRIDGHPSSRPLHVVWNGGALRDGDALRVAGWGMPIRGSSGKGDLRIICKVKPQGAWSEEQKRALKEVWPTWVEPMVSGESVVANRV